MPKERQTCTECSMRRQKCDRNIPCSRCVKRGDADKCSREWPDGGYDPRVHRVYPRPGATGTDDTSPGTVSTSESPMRAKRPNPTSEEGQRNLHPALRNGTRDDDHGYHATEVDEGGSGKAPQAISGIMGQTSENNAATVLEFLSWGRNKLNDYDRKTLDLLKEPHNSNVSKDPMPEWDASNGFGGTGAAQVSFLQLLLPNRRQIFQLVEYHLDNILWYHCCFHGDNFHRELREAYDKTNGLQMKELDLRWAALLFSILAGSMTCASDQVLQSWGFRKDERPKLTRQWYKATVSCLNLADFMWRHHLHSVEAITCLTMCAHILGFSNTQYLLLGTAYKIAQSLGLQRLGPESDPPVAEMTPAIKERIIKRERGRRVWSQVCLQDWFSIPFSEMYSIQALHFTTMPPLNMDDTTFEVMPDTVPTLTSFGTFLYHVASLMPAMHNAILSSNTLYTKYDQVLEYDRKLRYLVTETLPPFFSMRVPIEPSWPAWLPWARRAVTVCCAHKVIMIHRNFLGRSFTEPAFDFTRQTCIQAAKTILKESIQAYDEGGPHLWIDQAFMIAAGITLSLDIFHRKDTEIEYEDHRKLVENTISMLSKFDNSLIAQRGIRLLSSLLAEQARLSAAQTLENYRRQQSRSTAPNDSVSISSGETQQAGRKQKFDVPKFVESFVGYDDFAQNLRYKGPEMRTEMPIAINRELSSLSGKQDGTMSIGDKAWSQGLDLGYETFEQLFPPQAGISNTFLFEDLLNFDVP